MPEQESSFRITRTGLIRYGRNTGWLMAERAVKAVLGLTVGILVARYLGPRDYGLLNFAISLIALFTAFTTLGLDTLLVRELVGTERNAGRLLGTAIVMRFTGAISFISLLIVTLVWSNWQQTVQPLIVLISLTALFQSVWVVDTYFQARVEARKVVLPRLVAHVTGAVSKLALIMLHADVIWFAAVLVLESALIAGGLIHSYLRFKPSALKWGWDTQLAKKLLSDGWPLILSGLAASLYMRIDQVMLQQMVGPEAVGHYAAAVTLSEAWYFVPVAICASVFPAILRARGEGKEFYYHRLQTLYDLMIWSALGVAIPMVFFAEPVIYYLYGTAYQPAASVLTIHIWAGVFVAFGSAWSKWMIAEKRTRTILVFQLTAMGINVLLNLALIPRYGVNGAAVATLISYAFGHTFLAATIKSQHVALRMLAKSLFPFPRALAYIK